MDKVLLYIRTGLTIILVGLSAYMLLTGNSLCQSYAVGVLSALIGYWFGTKVEASRANGNSSHKRQ